MKPINLKLLTAILIPMMLIPMASFAYAHWTASIYKIVKMHVRCVNVGIITYKCLSPWDDKLIKRWPSDDELNAMGATTSIRINTSIFPGWYVWFGFIIQNQGIYPTYIEAPTYSFTDPEGIQAWFNHQEYFYGQIIDGDSCGWPREDVPQDVYAKVWVPSKKHLSQPPPPGAVLPPPPGNIPPPVYLEQYGPHTKNSMVLWAYLQLREDYVGPYPFTIEIALTITATAVLSP